MFGNSVPKILSVERISILFFTRIIKFPLNDYDEVFPNLRLAIQPRSFVSTLVDFSYISPDANRSVGGEQWIANLP